MNRPKLTLAMVESLARAHGTTLDVISLQQVKEKAAELGVDPVQLAELYDFSHDLDQELKEIRQGEHKNGCVVTSWSLYEFLKKLTLLGYIETRVARRTVEALYSFAEKDGILPELERVLNEYGYPLDPEKNPSVAAMHYIASQ